MSSKYQTSSTTTANFNSNSDNRLDELLEDLQSTVASRPLVNGTGNYHAQGSSGYREHFKSVSSQSNGKPGETKREYHIEYLNPNNTTSVVSERSTSPFYDKENLTPGPGKKVSSYKNVSYESSSNSKRTGSQAVPVYGTKSEKSETKFRNNINELDTLLDDLNHSQKVDFTSTSSSSHNNRLKTFDSGLKSFDSGFLEPLDTSTPNKKGHVSRIEESSFEEERYDSNANAAPVRTTEVKKEVYYNGEPVERYHNKEFSNGNARKELIFTGDSLRRREASPARQTQELYHYETKTSSSTKKGTELPARSFTRNYESDVVDNAIPFTYEYGNRSPSPSRSIQNYSSTVKESTTHRSPSPTKYYYSTTSSVRNNTTQPTVPVTRTTYSTIKTTQETNRRETHQRSPGTPPPHRSPSPITFSQPPDPPIESSVRTYNFEKNVSSRPTSPSLKQKFSPSDPSRDSIPGHTVITRNYKYHSQSKQSSTYPPVDTYKPEPTPTYTRPFPSPSPPPEIKDQRPPKQLDELMASFSDTEHREYRNNHLNRTSSSRCTTPAPEKIQAKKPPSPPATPVEKKQNFETFRKEKSNGVAGPPVYYPPGPLFTKKEEIIECDRDKGKMKANREAKYKYKSGSKMKESSDTKKTVVPLCLPVCCALPCAIM